MIKCPYCSSTAQMKLLRIDYCTFSHITELWECGCGCRVGRMSREQKRVIKFPNGGIKYEKGAK